MEVGFEDGFQDELHGPLDNAVTDSGNRKKANAFAARLRDLHPSQSLRSVRMRYEFLSEFLEKRFHASCLNGRERDTITARCAVILFGHSVRFLERLLLTDMDI